MYLKVFVMPGARKERIEERDEALVMAVREPALGNRANDRVRELLALRYRVPLAQVRLLTGHRSRSKLFSIGS